MKYKEFLEFLENNLDGYRNFIDKARRFQIAQNEKRPKKSRWPDGKIEKASYEMWKKAMETLYNNLKTAIKSDSVLSWKSYIEKNKILETLNESINEIDFSDNAA